MKKSTHGRWGDMYYIDPEISVTCSGGINGKPNHKPINMIMGTADVTLICPECKTVYGNQKRMETSFGTRMQYANGSTEQKTL